LPSGQPTESKQKGAFDVQAFLDSTGVARRIVEYGRADVIFNQGDPCESVLYIQKGGVKISVLSKTGREAVVAMLGPGDFFGEGGLAGQPVRMGTATASIRSTILSVDQDEMVRLLHEQHAMSDRFIVHLLARTIRIEEDLVDQLFSSSEKRLARKLLLLAQYGEHDKSERAVPAISQGDAGGNGRHDAIPREFLYEEIPATGVYRLQRWAQGQQHAAHGRLARLRTPRRAAQTEIATARGTAAIRRRGR
jgi:CRP-like cAMP-binding protein